MTRDMKVLAAICHVAKGGVVPNDVRFFITLNHPVTVTTTDGNLWAVTHILFHDYGSIGLCDREPNGSWSSISPREVTAVHQQITFPDYEIFV